MSRRNTPAPSKNNPAVRANVGSVQEANSEQANTTTNDQLLQAIDSLRFELKQDNNHVRNDITSLHQELSGKLDSMAEDVKGLSDRMSEAEERVGYVEDVTQDLGKALIDSLKRQRSLQDKLTDLESRSRRNNIRIFGVDEREKPASMTQFVGDFLKRELQLSIELKIQRAHRIFTKQQTLYPRPIIVNFQEFTTKEMVLKEAWKKRGIQMHGKSIYFDHDYAAETVQKRKEYQKIKAVLKEKGTRFQTPYTNISIYWDDGVRLYSSARDAALELRRRELEIDVPKAMTGEEEAENWQQRLRGLRREGRISSEAGPTAAQRAKERLREFKRADDV